MSIMGIRPDELTVILPTRNEAHNIHNFLKSLPENINLIVIDASEDPTQDIVNSLRPDYTELIRHPATVTEARRIGADAEKTPWLLFTDADIVFSAEYFRNISEVEEYDVIYGLKLSSDRYRAYYKWFSTGQRPLHILGIPAASGSNCIINKEAYDATGDSTPSLPVMRIRSLRGV
jgi:glycosyltransferase involved in cell wall biosynthesis